MGNRSWDREMRCRIDLNPCLDNGIDYRERKKGGCGKGKEAFIPGILFPIPTGGVGLDGKCICELVGGCGVLNRRCARCDLPLVGNKNHPHHRESVRRAALSHMELASGRR